MCGIIDSDFRAIEEITQIKDEKLLALRLHEAESFICLPEIIVSISNKLNLVEEQPTIDGITDFIFAQLVEQKITIALKRCFTKFSKTIRLSLTKNETSCITTPEQAISAISNVCEKQSAIAKDVLDIQAFEISLNEQIREIEKAINDRDICSALKFLPGKELANKLARKIKCVNADTLMRSIKNNLGIEEFALLKELSLSIEAALNSAK